MSIKNQTFDRISHISSRVELKIIQLKIVRILYPGPDQFQLHLMTSENTMSIHMLHFCFLLASVLKILHNLKE